MGLSFRSDRECSRPEGNKTFARQRIWGEGNAVVAIERAATRLPVYLTSQAKQTPPVFDTNSNETAMTKDGPQESSSDNPLAAQPSTAQTDDDSEVVEAVVVDAEVVTAATADSSRIRTGSPFRKVGGQVESEDGTVPGFDPRTDGAAMFDRGIAASTARGGLLAALLIIPFGVASIFVFPLGAMMIGVLGAMLAMFALTTGRSSWTLLALSVNLLIAGSGYVGLF
jgi:hypothetical protein